MFLVVNAQVQHTDTESECIEILVGRRSRSSNMKQLSSFRACIFKPKEANIVNKHNRGGRQTSWLQCLQAWLRSWTGAYWETTPAQWSGWDLNPQPLDFMSLALSTWTRSIFFPTGYCAIPAPLTGSRDGAVVRTLASHHCVPGLIPGPGIICGLSLLLVLYSEVFLWVLRFPPLLKTNISRFQFDPGIHGHFWTNFSELLMLRG